MRNRTRGPVTLIGLVAATVLGAATTQAAACPPAKPTQFDPGSDTMTLTGAAARGTRDCYALPLRYGQRLVILQGTDPSTQSVLQLFRPPWRIERADQSFTIIGAALPGTEDGREATRFEGRVPVTGDYLLVVGATSGGGGYRIMIGAR